MVWIGTGAILLASTTGNLAQGPVEWFAEWWPWPAVGIGVWFLIESIAPGGRRPEEHLTLPLAGGVDMGVQRGVGSVRILGE